MQEIIIIAGPNGAGKTSFANEYYASENHQSEYINADEIARRLKKEGVSTGQLDLKAGREMLKRIEELAQQRQNFTLETTLANLGYARKIPTWQKQGYVVILVYLRLPSIEDALARVKRRVELGGHNIPEATIRRRFDRSLSYLNERYKPVVDEWYVWNSLENSFKPAETWNDPK